MKKIFCLIAILLLAGGAYYAYTNNVLYFGANNKEEKIISAAKEVLFVMEIRNYERLEGLISSHGLSYEIYPRMDFSKSNIPKTEISDVANDPKQYIWGYRDGSGAPIERTRKDLIDSINDSGFWNGRQMFVNKTVDKGGAVINEIPENSNGRDFVAIEYPGSGLSNDWKTLYLIFDLEDGEYMLRGVAFNYWTI